jgi:hypothetical protein
MITRRDFIKTMSLLSGAVLTPVHWLGKWAGVQPAQAEELEVGELYAGFVLLPEGARVPEFVRQPRLGIPNFCGVGDSTGPLASTTSFKTDQDLANNVTFPIYTIKEQPMFLVQNDIYVTKHPTGEIYCTTICFSDSQTNNEIGKWKVYLWAYPDFPQPYPLWSSEPVESDNPFITLDKVAFLPQPGIISPTADGYAVYWIERDVLYYVLLEPVPDFQYAQTILENLSQIR